MTTMAKLKDLFPKIKPYNEGYLKVSKLHTIYYEECSELIKAAQRFSRL